jgi:hypothetical protein
MTDPDESYIPDDGDPWLQQQQELEQQDATEDKIKLDSIFKTTKIPSPTDHNVIVPDSADPF